jgi:hypothetical protein
MSAQKILEVENSNSFISSGDIFEPRFIVNESSIRDFELRKLKGALKFSFGVVYFFAVIYLLVKLFS